MVGYFVKVVFTEGTCKHVAREFRTDFLIIRVTRGSSG